MQQHRRHGWSVRKARTFRVSKFLLAHLALHGDHTPSHRPSSSVGCRMEKLKSPLTRGLLRMRSVFGIALSNSQYFQSWNVFGSSSLTRRQRLNIFHQQLVPIRPRKHFPVALSDTSPRELKALASGRCIQDQGCS